MLRAWEWEWKHRGLQLKLQNTSSKTFAHVLLADEIAGDGFPQQVTLPAVTATLNDGAFLIDSSRFSRGFLTVRAHACSCTVAVCSGKIPCFVQALPRYTAWANQQYYEQTAMQRYACAHERKARTSIAR